MLLNGMVLKVLVRRHYLSKGLKQVKRRAMWIFQGGKKDIFEEKMEDWKMESSDGVCGEGELWTSRVAPGEADGQTVHICVCPGHGV